MFIGAAVDSTQAAAGVCCCCLSGGVADVPPGAVPTWCADVFPKRPPLPPQPSPLPAPAAGKAAASTPVGRDDVSISVDWRDFRNPATRVHIRNHTSNTLAGRKHGATGGLAAVVNAATAPPPYGSNTALSGGVRLAREKRGGTAVAAAFPAADSPPPYGGSTARSGAVRLAREKPGMAAAALPAAYCIAWVAGAGLGISKLCRFAGGGTETDDCQHSSL